MRYIQTPFKTNEFGQKEKETLCIKGNNITCTCLANRVNKNRDIQSNCKHITWYMQDKDNLKERGWYEIKGNY